MINVFFLYKIELGTYVLVFGFERGLFVCYRFEKNYECVLNFSYVATIDLGGGVRNYGCVGLG